MDQLPKLPRRRFLLGSAALLGASALGLPGKSWADAAKEQVPASPGLTKALQALRNGLKGRLILPDEQGYEMAAWPNNARWASVRPRAIAMCADAEDVQQCVRYTKESGEPFAIRSGGHNYAGFSTTTGLLIDVKPMNKVQADDKSQVVVVQGGANNQNMADALRLSHFSVPSGRCPTVGVGGLVLGGGWGFAATHAGLTCDSLLGADVVLASGEIVRANERGDYADLFWALRGGGGGNFGVCTSFSFRLKDVQKVTIFNITWPAVKQVELLLALQKIQLDNAYILSTRTKALPTEPGPNPKRDQLRVATLGQFWGTVDELKQVLGPAFSIATPISADIRLMDYWQARDYLITDDPVGMYDIRSSYVETSLSGDAIENMLRWMSRWPGGSLLPENMGILFAIGGRVKSVDKDATAYVHRDANFIFQMECSWAPIDKPETVAAQERWLAEYFADMQKYVMPRTYVNFPNRNTPNWQQAYYGSNLERLMKIKSKYDPDNLFRFEQSIPLYRPSAG